MIILVKIWMAVTLRKKITGSGVLFARSGDKIQIFTNRHVIDCSYTQNCYQRLSEDFNVRTYDGKFHKVSRVYVAPHHLDIAVLEINANELEWYNQTFYRKNLPTIGEKVVAIGYPSFTQNVLEYSTKNGQITSFRNLIMDDGFSFKAIDSDAYTYFGSSGGGLFDDNGLLVGINTWIQGTQNSVAIDINSKNNLNEISLNTKSDLEKYIYCENGNYIYFSNKIEECLPYCNRDDVMGTDFKCYKICEDFYCESQKFNVNNPRCPKGQIAGSDEYCHFPCESPSTYCVGNNFCYQNKCVSCPSTLTKLFKDGTCRFYN